MSPSLGSCLVSFDWRLLVDVVILGVRSLLDSLRLPDLRDLDPSLLLRNDHDSFLLVENPWNLLSYHERVVRHGGLTLLEELGHLRLAHHRMC